MQYKVLFVDDEAANLRLLERVFRDNYDVFTATSGEEALDQLSVHDVALIVSDQRMPEMNGSEFLKLAAESRPQTVRIMLTGYTDANDLVDAINSGVVYKYITKPWVNEDLQQTVKRALQHYETTKAQRQLQMKSERLQARLNATREGFIDVVLRMLDRRLPKSREHAERTAALASCIGERFQLERGELETLTLAARLHDVAHYWAPENVVLKQTRLTKDEADVANEGLETGVRMLEAIPDLADVAALLRFHYEYFDGSGGPAGFSGMQIPLAARIVAVAEAYDKLLHPQGRTEKMDPENALQVLIHEAGKRFDPDVIDVLCETVKESSEEPEVELRDPAR